MKKSEKRRLVIDSVENLLQDLGVFLEDPNFKETPRRFADYLLEHFVSEETFSKEVKSLSKAVFPAEYDGMVIQTGIITYGICPHHLLPIHYLIDIGYIPRKTAIGLSKLARLAETYSKLPILQESLTKKLAIDLGKLLKTPDIAVSISGQHQCMTVRGVKAHNSKTVTASLLGAFMEQSEAREEFNMLRTANGK